MRAILCIAVAVLFLAVLPVRSEEFAPPTTAVGAEGGAGERTDLEPAEMERCHGDGAVTAPPQGLEDIEKGLEQTSPLPGKSASLPLEDEQLLAALL